MLTRQSTERANSKARFSSNRVLSCPRPSRIRAGVARSCGEPQGQIPGTALHLLPFGPPCRGRPSSRTACPAVRTSGQWAISSGSPSPLPRGLTATGRRPRSLPAKGKVQRHFLEGTQAAFGRASPRGAYWLSARRPRPCWLKSESTGTSKAQLRSLRSHALPPFTGGPLG